MAEEELPTYIPTPEEAWEILERTSRLNGKLVVPKNPRFTRSDVVNSFVTAFETIGGVTRLALWANENPTEFYKMFSRLLPSASISEIVTRRDDGDIKTLTTEELEALLAEIPQSNVHQLN